MVLTQIPKKIDVGRAQNLIGQRFGKLIVLFRMEDKSTTGATWYCKCDCGNYTKARTSRLLKGSIKSYGCWNTKRDRHYNRPNWNDYTGQIINGFQVIEQDLTRETGQGKHRYWKVICPYCHRIFSIKSSNLKTQNSCGCIKSKGEYLINQILSKENIKYKTQYIFQDLPNRKFDFAIFSDNHIQYIIEYDGEQHFNKHSKYYSEDGITRDREKDKYCLIHNIPLYRIPYYEYETIHTLNDIIKDQYLVTEESLHG